MCASQSTTHPSQGATAMAQVGVSHVYAAAFPIFGHHCNLPMRSFTSFFGISAYLCARVWNETFPLFDNDVQLHHLLWALLFLKTYQKEAVLVSLTHCRSRKTFRKYLWKVLLALEEKALTHVSSFLSWMYFCCPSKLTWCCSIVDFMG